MGEQQKDRRTVLLQDRSEDAEASSFASSASAAGSAPSGASSRAGGDARRHRDADAPPFSFRHEVSYFFSRGMPLCVAAAMSFGVPPLAAMIFAGHTSKGDSAHLQASLGYARVWYNCTCLMPMQGMMAYFTITVPGCVGAGRRDRIPRYFQRSVVLIALFMLPSYLLQIASGDLLSAFGVPASNAVEVAFYCRWMIITSLLTLIDNHFIAAFNNLGYVNSATLNSIVTGFGMDMTSTYLFIFRWGWGIHGAAFSRIVTMSVKCVIWCLLTLSLRLTDVICISASTPEPLCNLVEFKEFARLGVPNFLTNLAGWLIFELQVMAIANIHGISQDGLAAGSIWVQLETVLASVQTGWISTASMRSLALLGRQNPHALQAFHIFHALSSVAVAIFNLLLLVFNDDVCRFMSNDVAVQNWLGDITWVLVAHTQSRISCLISLFLFIPLGQGMQRTLVTFVCFYLIASPPSAVVALTDLVTQSVKVKMVACCGATTVAQVVQAIYNFYYLHKVNWVEAGAIINRRANTDKRRAIERQLSAGGGPPGGPAEGRQELGALT